MQANAPDPLQLTPAQEAARKRRQTQRSVAIAIGLLALVVVFYIVTIIQMGSNSGVPSS